MLRSDMVNILILVDDVATTRVDVVRDRREFWVFWRLNSRAIGFCQDLVALKRVKLLMLLDRVRTAGGLTGLKLGRYKFSG
jgi:hypothetical protein